MAYAYDKRGVWYIGYKDEAGKPKQEATKARTKTEARRIGEEQERRCERIRLGLETRDQPLTLGQLWQQWSEAKALNASADTDEIRWRVHLAERFGALQLAHLKPVDLETFLQSKLRERGGDLSTQSVHHLRLLISRLYNWAHRKNLYSGDNPAERVDLPQIVEQAPRTAAPDSVVKLLATAAEPYRTIYAVCVYAGLRSDEVLGLEVQAVDLLTGVIRVERQGKRESTKNGRWRAVPIVDQLRPLLEARCAAVGTGRLFNLYGRKNGKHPVKHARQHILREMRKALRRAGLPDGLTVHELRHTFISQLSQSGADPRAVQALAGQADLKTTQRYIHLHDQYLAGQAAKLSYVATQKQASA